MLRQRNTVGYLLGDKWLDGGSLLAALVALLPIWPVWGTRPWLDMLLTFVGLYQVSGMGRRNAPHWAAVGIRSGARRSAAIMSST